MDEELPEVDHVKTWIRFVSWSHGKSSPDSSGKPYRCLIRHKQAYMVLRYVGWFVVTTGMITALPLVVEVNHRSRDSLEIEPSYCSWLCL
jgi:hypothetical protein